MDECVQKKSNRYQRSRVWCPAMKFTAKRTLSFTYRKKAMSKDALCCRDDHSIAFRYQQSALDSIVKPWTKTKETIDPAGNSV